MRSALLLVLGLMSIGCMQLGKGGTSSAQQAEPTDQEIRATYGDQVGAQVTEIRARRKAALLAPTSLPDANAYADVLIAGLKANLGQINGIDWNAYVKDASDTLGRATQTAQGDEAANALAKRATFQATLGDNAGAVATLKTAFEHGHTYLSGLGMVKVYAHEKNPAAAASVCEKTRPLAKDEDQVYELLGECLKAAEPKNTAKETLPWVSAEDWTMYERRSREEQEQRLAQRQADEERDAERRRQQEEARAAGGSDQSQPGAAPGASQADSGRATFTLRSSCSKTVKVFFGDTPKYGSGRTTPIGGNSVQNQSLNDGDMMWIVDDSGNGISSVSVSSSTREVEITSSCTSFSAR